MRPSPRLILWFLAITAVAIALWWRPWVSALPDPELPASQTEEVSESQLPATEEQASSKPSDEIGPQDLEQRAPSAGPKLETTVTSDSGQPLSGTGFLLTVTDTLIKSIQESLTISPNDIYALGDLKEVVFDQGQLQFELPTTGRHFIWLEVPGHRIQSWHLPQETLPEQITLQRCSPFHLKVTDLEGGMIPHALTMIQAVGADPNYATADWPYRVTRRTLQIHGRTNADGIAAFDTLPDFPLFVWSKVGGGMGQAGAENVKPEGTHTLKIGPGFMVSGWVSDLEERPIPGAAVIIFRDDENGKHVMVGSAATDDKGHFVADGVNCPGVNLVGAFYLDGYEMQVRPVPSPRPGAEFEFHVQLAPAVKFDVELSTGDGAPLTDVDISFATNPYDWLPFRYQTKDTGRFSTMAVFREGAQYWMHVKSGGAALESVRILAPEAGATLKVALSGFGALTKTAKQLQAGSEWDFIPNGHAEGRTFYWQDAAQTPWLPSGPGVLQKWQGNTVVGAFEVVIPSGVDAWPEAASPSEALLEFALELLPEESVSAFAVGGGSLDVPLGELTNAEQQLQLSFARTSVELRSNQRGTLSLGTFSQQDLPLNLGPISWPAGGSILGKVQSDQEFPIVGCSVQLLGAAGQVLREIRSGNDGAFAFTRVTPGAYQLRVQPSDGQASWNPETTLSLNLTAPGQVLEPRIILAEGSPLKIKLSAGAWRRPQAWLMQNSQLQRTTFDRSWVATFPQPVVAARTWVVDADPESSHTTPALRIAYAEVLPGQTSVALELSTAQLAELKIEGAHGSGQVRVLGPRRQTLTSLAVSTSRTIKLQAHSAAPIFLQWSELGKLGPSIPLADALRTRSLPTSGDETELTLQVVDLQSHPLSGTMCLVPAAGTSRLADRAGMIHLPSDLLGLPIEFHRPGFFPTQVSLQNNQQIQLRRLSGTITIQTSKQAPSVRLVPQFTTSVPPADLTAQSNPLGEIKLGALPEGTYQLFRLSPNGEVFKQSMIQIPATERLELSKND